MSIALPAEGLSERLRTARMARNLSIRAAADEIGLSVSTLHQAENGADIRISTASRILRWLTPEENPCTPAATAESASSDPSVGSGCTGLSGSETCARASVPATSQPLLRQRGRTMSGNPQGLTEFLLARIAEKEHIGCRSSPGEGRPSVGLAECEAVRRIVDAYVYPDGEWSVRCLATPYAEHPDYREEWKP